MFIPPRFLCLSFVCLAACCYSVCYGFSSHSTPISLDALVNKRILVVGGSGRVGGSVVTQLLKANRNVQVTVGGTNYENFQRAQSRWNQQLKQVLTDRQSTQSLVDGVSFVHVSRENAESFQNIGSKYDLVVHTAGPFQGKATSPNGVLQACVDAAVPYVDVCDDYSTATAAQQAYSAKAVKPCILSTGTWPGVSSLMAKQLVKGALQKYPRLQPSDLHVDFSFFTAGTGGAGVTLLVATFLILAEQALVVRNGKPEAVPPMQEFTPQNFGPLVGDKQVAPMNLLEAASIADCLNVGNTSCKFGTAPWYWNTLLALFVKLVPREMLENEDIMRKLSIFSMPIVRVVDAFAGATNAIRVDLSAPSSLLKISHESQTDESVMKNDLQNVATAIYAHENLEPCVGECIVAFAAAALSGAIPPGVWFPEQAVTNESDAAAVLGLASIGAHTVSVEGSLNMNVSKVFGREEETSKKQQVKV